ncbi:spore germination protein [Paenibacillus sp. MWE-103]|uniref:Spore germination protein n=1 Tax=Paenibacillus artemisiicola TaxID=1172618 RepID=A0ABS3W7B8_9BACL|nr:spore germination protein [Paenibacillus artemisiicola]MBO7744214.1 spore germination protein [Paenibacillus artemisiicola]
MRFRTRLRTHMAARDPWHSAQMHLRGAGIRLPERFGPALQDNVRELRAVYADCPDVIFRPFAVGGGTEAVLVYIDGLSDTEGLNENVLTPLMAGKSEEARAVKELVEKRLAVSGTKGAQGFAEAVGAIAEGNALLLIDRLEEGILLSVSKFEKRAIQEPSAESVVRGPREGFTETMKDNLSLLRRRIRSPLMKFQTLKIGRYTQTEVAVAYIQDLADPELIEEVKRRLARIDVDGVLDSGNIEEYIEDMSFSPFPQIVSTERPDVAASGLLEGRAVVLAEGSPFALIAPVTLFSLAQASEDYYERFMLGTMIRWMRIFLMAISLMLPSIYVALLAFHQEMIPTRLLISISASREQIPFPALVEALLMELTFEALREAGIRLPKQVGSAVSIVGALIIGDAAVSAGLVSPPMVMVVAFTGIASFTTGRYNVSGAFRILRFPLILLAGTLGLLGVLWGLILILIHLCTLRSFGVPYLSGLAPAMRGEWKDVLIRAPIWSLNRRPKLGDGPNPVRQPRGTKPGSSEGGG